MKKYQIEEKEETTDKKKCINETYQNNAFDSEINYWCECNETISTTIGEYLWKKKTSEC